VRGPRGVGPLPLPPWTSIGWTKLHRRFAHFCQWVTACRTLTASAPLLPRVRAGPRRRPMVLVPCWRLRQSLLLSPQRRFPLIGSAQGAAAQISPSARSARHLDVIPSVPRPSSLALLLLALLLVPPGLLKCPEIVDHHPSRLWLRQTHLQCWRRRYQRGPVDRQMATSARMPLCLTVPRRPLGSSFQRQRPVRISQRRLLPGIAYTATHLP